MHITYIIKLLSIQRDVDGEREREQWSRGYTMEQQTRMHAYDRFFSRAIFLVLLCIHTIVNTMRVLLVTDYKSYEMWMHGHIHMHKHRHETHEPK